MMLRNVYFLFFFYVFICVSGLEERVELPSNNILHFLFMVYDKIGNEDVWAHFFQQHQDHIDFKIFVHSKNDFIHPTLFSVVQVPNVPSQWCRDLIGPMIQLLNFSLETVSSFDEEYRNKSNHMYLFLSADAVPTKSMSEMYNVLRRTNFKSSLCFTPSNQWVTSTSTWYGVQ